VVGAAAAAAGDHRADTGMAVAAESPCAHLVRGGLGRGPGPAAPVPCDGPAAQLGCCLLQWAPWVAGWPGCRWRSGSGSSLWDRLRMACWPSAWAGHSTGRADRRPVPSRAGAAFCHRQRSGVGGDAVVTTDMAMASVRRSASRFPVAWWPLFGGWACSIPGHGAGLWLLMMLPLLLGLLLGAVGRFHPHSPALKRRGFPSHSTGSLAGDCLKEPS